MTEDTHDPATPISPPANADEVAAQSVESGGPPVLSVEELDPIELVEVDDDGPEPAEGWGDDGEGSEQDPDGEAVGGAETTGGAV